MANNGQICAIPDTLTIMPNTEGIPFLNFITDRYKHQHDEWMGEGVKAVIRAQQVDHTTGQIFF